MGSPAGERDRVHRIQREVVQELVFEDMPRPRRGIPIPLVDKPQRIGVGSPERTEVAGFFIVAGGCQDRPERVEGGDSPRTDVHGQEDSRGMPHDSTQILELAGRLPRSAETPEEVPPWIEDPDSLIRLVGDVDSADFVNRQADHVAEDFRAIAAGSAGCLPQAHFLDQHEVRFGAGAEEVAVVHADSPGGERVDPGVVVPLKRIARG